MRKSSFLFLRLFLHFLVFIRIIAVIRKLFWIVKFFRILFRKKCLRGSISLMKKNKSITSRVNWVRKRSKILKYFIHLLKLLLHHFKLLIDCLRYKIYRVLRVITPSLPLIMIKLLLSFLIISSLSSKLLSSWILLVVRIILVSILLMPTSIMGICSIWSQLIIAILISTSIPLLPSGSLSSLSLSLPLPLPFSFSYSLALFSKSCCFL